MKKGGRRNKFPGFLGGKKLPPKLACTLQKLIQCILQNLNQMYTTEDDKMYTAQPEKNNNKIEQNRALFNVQ